MKFKRLFVVGLLFSFCAGAIAQEKVIAIWLPEDEDGVLNKGRKMQMATKLRQEINETLYSYGFRAVMRQETLKEKELAYTQSGNTSEEARSGNERLGDYYLSPHVYSLGDDRVYIVVDILTHQEEVLVTDDRDVRLSNLTEEFANLALGVLNRLIEKLGTENIAQNYVEFPNLRLQVQTVDAGVGDWATANRLCREMDVAGGGWRLPTETEMSQILQQTGAITKLHITLDDTFWTSTDGDRPNFKKTVQATVLREIGSNIDIKSSSSFSSGMNTITKCNPVPSSSYTGSSYKVRAVRKY